MTIPVTIPAVIKFMIKQMLPHVIVGRKGTNRSP
jgi:hypothetical protein